jgi:hypothetical protein
LHADFTDTGEFFLTANLPIKRGKISGREYLPSLPFEETDRIPALE